MTNVIILHRAKSTNSKGWHTRRNQKLLNAVLNCCCMINPMEARYLDVDCLILNNGSLYRLEVHFDDSWTKDQINMFVRIASKIKIFHSVLPLDTTQPSDTIPPCQEETEQHHRQPATLLT